MADDNDGGGNVVDVVILGAGFAGLCAAIELERAGRHSFVVLEKADDVGGTWRDNTYPGVECDVPSHLYSYSFAPNPNWSKSYSPGKEILGYIKDCAERFGVRDRIRFGAQALTAQWADGHWTVVTTDGDSVRGRFLIAGLGGLHTPNVAELPGLSSFGGSSFHTARWDHTVDLVGKRVGMVGTGATAVQSAPEVAEQASAFFLFQRSPIWCGPKRDEPFSTQQKDAFAADPDLLRQYRWSMWKSWETSGVDIFTVGTGANRKAQEAARRNLLDNVDDPTLAAKLMPDYNITCKRPTFSNRYYPMFNRPNVELVTSPIEAVLPTGIATTSGQIDLDVIIMATGFKAFDITHEIDIVGLDGVHLHDAWSTRIRTYRSVMVNGFPNMFILLGPNSSGLTSALQMIEAGARYAAAVIDGVSSRDLGAVHPRNDQIDMFLDRIDTVSATTAMNHGCRSWWTKNGQNEVVWPESSVTYRMMLREFRPEHFEMVAS
jgi:cation diffusion facilitator CzcD-associated flavoprotein CzcO